MCFALFSYMCVWWGSVVACASPVALCCQRSRTRANLMTSSMAEAAAFRFFPPIFLLSCFYIPLPCLYFLLFVWFPVFCLSFLNAKWVSVVSCALAACVPASLQVAQQALLPGISDKSLFVVECKTGKENTVSLPSLPSPSLPPVYIQKSAFCHCQRIELLIYDGAPKKQVLIATLACPSLPCESPMCPCQLPDLPRRTTRGMFEFELPSFRSAHTVDGSGKYPPARVLSECASITNNRGCYPPLPLPDFDPLARVTLHSHE